MAHGKATVFKVDGAAGSLVALTDSLKSVSVKRNRKSEDATVFGVDRMLAEQGLKDATISVSGLWNTTIDAHMAGIIG